MHTLQNMFTFHFVKMVYAITDLSSTPGKLAQAGQPARIRDPT